VPNQEKKDKVKQIKKWFEKADSLLVLHYRGLKVSEANELRKQISGLEGELRVLKNTLTRIALADTPREELVPLFEGPVAVVFMNDDPAPVARAIRDFARGRQEFFLLGGMLEGRVLTGKEVEAFAMLPTREVLVAIALGRLASPLSGLVNVMAGPIRQLLGVLEAVAVKQAAAAPPEAPKQAPAAPPEAPHDEVDQAELNADGESED
jgi:large subunit ribosomal protein L10